MSTGTVRDDLNVWAGSTPQLIASATVVSAAGRSAGPVTVLVAPSNGAVNVEYIGVSDEHAGTGLAEKALRAMCSAADDEKVALTGHADPGFGSDLKRLVRWYSRHGFTIVKIGPSVEMRRDPM